MQVLFNNRIFKKIQSAFLVICMLAGMLSAGIGASAASPEIASVTVNETRTVITIEFKNDIQEAKGITVKNKVRICRGKGLEETLPAFSTVTVRSSSIVITIQEPLTDAQNYFVIESGAFKDQTGKITTPNINGLDPKLSSTDGISLDETKKIITLKFTGAISGYPNDESLKNGYISLSRDGKTFDEAINASQITVNGSKGEIIIKLTKELTGVNSRIKIASGKVKSISTGNVNVKEIFSSTVSAVTTDAPKLLSTDVNSSGDRVTFNFDRKIRRSAGISASSLKASIRINRNGIGNVSLSTYDELELNDKALILRLYRPLSGTDNYITIDAGVIASVESGDPIVQTITTEELTVGGATQATGTPPLYAGIIYDKSNLMVRIFFDKNIRTTSTAKLLEGIDLSTNSESFKPFENFKNIEVFNSNSILISLKTALIGNSRFRINGNVIQDYNGNVQKSNLYTEYLDEYGNGNYMDELPDGDTSEDEDAKQEENTDDQNKDQESTTPPDTTQPVTPPADDTKQEEVTDVIVTLNGAVADITTNYTSSDALGNTSHTLKVESSKAEPLIVSKGYGITLDAIVPTSSYGATLSIPGDIFKLLMEKGGSISVQCGAAIHKIPLALLNMNQIKTELGVTDSTIANISVELAVVRAGNIYEKDLDLSATAGKYSVVVEPMEYSLQYKSANTIRALTKFEKYIEKSFAMDASMEDNQRTTVVRVETSGKVNHVPSRMAVDADGDVHLTALTRQNGVYAVITSTRDYSDTPTWAVPAVNSLAARQILGDFTGSKLKPSQAATRAEVAGIVTKGMGIYTDKSGASNFLDVTLTDDYYTATAVAVEYGLINGYGDNTFKPDRNITRQEAAAILARTLRLAKNMDTASSSTMTSSEADKLVSKFDDASAVAEWAKADVAECIKAGIINGDNNNRINPNSNVTRAEIIQMVYNLLTSYGFIGK